MCSLRLLRRLQCTARRGVHTHAPHHLVTPLIRSDPLTDILHANGGGDTTNTVMVKLDVLQPSGSFKIRGIGYHANIAVKERGVRMLVSSSGGNAGMAVAYSGRQLGVPVNVVVPSTTPVSMMDAIREQGATVIVHGDVWDEANEEALRRVEEAQASGTNAALIHPFDHPEVWEGHSSLITEVHSQLAEQGLGTPSAVITVVGGGGLLCGIMQGMDRVDWGGVPVLACETAGANAFHEAFEARKLVTLPAITSVAKSLGALTVAKGVLETALQEHRSIHPMVVTDKQAVEGCVAFAQHHRMLVEPACGAAVAGLVSFPSHLRPLLKQGGPVVVVACGGNMVSPQSLLDLQAQLA